MAGLSVFNSPYFMPASALVATTAIGLKFNVPLVSFQSLALAMGGQAATFFLSKMIKNYFLMRAENLIKFFEKIPLNSRPSVFGSPFQQATQIRAWMQSHREDLSRITFLDLDCSVLALDSIYRLKIIPQEIRYFTGLRRLNLGHNEITSLAHVTFPASLEELNLAGNPIGSLAYVTFPASLRKLNLNFTDITTLAHVNFPASLELLDLGNNRITDLANVTFPTSLKKLWLYCNKITSLAHVNFPASLEELDLCNNRITDLANVTFPTSLRWLALVKNRIASLANVTFPASLIGLSLVKNRITSLTHVNFPVSLQFVKISGNELENIDPLLNLSRDCDVNVEHNALSETYLETFQQALSTRRNALHSTQGPQIHWTVDVPRVQAAHATFPTQISASFSDQLTTWTQEIFELSKGLPTERFASLETSLVQDEKTILANYLGRLREVKDYWNGTIASKQNVITRVAYMLDLAAKNRDFKEEMIAVISGGLESCGDRVLITFNDIEILTQMHQEMDDAKAAKLAIRAQRYEELKKYAQNKAREFGLGDETETILYFQLKLRSSLDLPITTEDMLYPGVSGVSSEMLNAAEAIMRKISDEELLGKSDFWQMRLKKKFGQKMQAIQEEYTELLDNACEYDKKKETEREQFLTSHPKFKALLEEFEKPFNYKDLAEAIAEGLRIAKTNIWKIARSENMPSSESSASTSSVTSSNARAI